MEGPTPETSDVLDIVGLLHQTTLERELWTTFLDRLRQRLGARQALLGESVGLAYSVGGSAEWVRRYHERFRHISPFLPHMMQARAGDVLHTASMVDLERFYESEYYREFLVPQGVGLGAGGIVFGVDDGFADISVMYPCDKRAVDAEHLELLGVLACHARTALEVQRRLDAFAIERRLALEALEWLPFGVVFLDGDGRPTAMSERARRLLATSEPIRGLFDGAPKANPVVRAIQELCLRTSQRKGDQVPMGGCRRIPLGDSNWCEILVAPLEQPRATSASAPGAAVVFIHDSTEPLRPDAGRLRDLFGFTEAEAQVAEQLVHGRTVKEIAWEGDVAVSTVRTQIRALLDKTGTSRQVDLVHALVRSLAGLSPS